MQNEGMAEKQWWRPKSEEFVQKISIVPIEVYWDLVYLNFSTSFEATALVLIFGVKVLTFSSTVSERSDSTPLVYCRIMELKLQHGM